MHNVCGKTDIFLFLSAFYKSLLFGIKQKVELDLIDFHSMVFLTTLT
jgi:hypothetical protein